MTAFKLNRITVVKCGQYREIRCSAERLLMKYFIAPCGVITIKFPVDVKPDKIEYYLEYQCEQMQLDFDGWTLFVADVRTLCHFSFQ